LLSFLDQLINELADPVPSTPANNIGRNLVGDAEGEDGRVARTGQHCPSHCLAGFPSQPRGIQNAKVFVPGNINEDFEMMLGGKIEKPSLRHVVDPQSIGTQQRDLRKILFGLLP
jgi:hypothetical protein